jgi:hypothetical protein
LTPSGRNNSSKYGVLSPLPGSPASLARCRAMRRSTSARTSSEPNEATGMARRSGWKITLVAVHST